MLLDSYILYKDTLCLYVQTFDAEKDVLFVLLDSHILYKDTLWLHGQTFDVRQETLYKLFENCKFYMNTLDPCEPNLCALVEQFSLMFCNHILHIKTFSLFSPFYVVTLQLAGIMKFAFLTS